MGHEQGQPSLPVNEWMHPSVQYLRKNAFPYLRSTTNREAFRGIDLESARLLDGGIMSACFLLQNNHLPQVFKISIAGAPMEGEVLYEWNAHSVKVPRVHHYGRDGLHPPLNIVLMEAIFDETGKLAPTADKKMKENLSLSFPVGAAMGRELARMHDIPIPSKLFGSTHAIDEFHQVADSWNEYVRKEVVDYIPALRFLGYSHQQIQTILTNIDELPFDGNITYIHNDPSPRNILVTSSDPVDICIIDPNPIIGNKYWDLAHVVNKTDSARKKADKARGNRDYQVACESQIDFTAGVLQTYQEATEQAIDIDLLVACQLPRSLKRYAWFQRMAAYGTGPVADDLEVAVARQMVQEQAERILAL